MVLLRRVSHPCESPLRPEGMSCDRFPPWSAIRAWRVACSDRGVKAASERGGDMAKRVSKSSLGPYLWAGALLGWVSIAVADVWDPGDQAVFSANELLHGSEQVH